MSKKKDQPEGAAVADESPRKRRGASQFVVFKQSDNETDYVKIAEGASVKACVKAIEEAKVTGNLVIACVRRRLTAAVTEVLKLT